LSLTPLEGKPSGGLFLCPLLFIFCMYEQILELHPIAASAERIRRSYP